MAKNRAEKLTPISDLPASKRKLPQGGSSTAPPDLSHITDGLRNKYLRELCTCPCGYEALIDVYDVLSAFGVTCQPTGHAIKKLLCAGQRGSKSRLQDLQEAAQAIERAIQIEERRSFTKEKSYG